MAKFKIGDELWKIQCAATDLWVPIQGTYYTVVEIREVTTNEASYTEYCLGKVDDGCRKIFDMEYDLFASKQLAQQACDKLRFDAFEEHRSQLTIKLTEVNAELDELTRKSTIGSRVLNVGDKVKFKSKEDMLDRPMYGWVPAMNYLYDQICVIDAKNFNSKLNTMCYNIVGSNWSISEDMLDLDWTEEQNETTRTSK